MTRRIVLVTGGAGFIGSNIVSEFAADPSLDVVVCDRLRGAESGKWRNLVGRSIADIIAPETLWDWLEPRAQEIVLVVHMAAVSSTTEPDVDKIVRVNFGFSRDLYDWCARHGRRFIYASSAATYGAGEGGFDDHLDARGLAALRPLNAYGWSKALFDAFAARETARGHTPAQCVGLKFFNVYGANEEHKGAMRSMVSQIWPDVAAGRAVRLFKSYREGIADGGQKRDFIHVRDIVRVVAWLGVHRGVNGLFNLGTGEARTFEELAMSVFAAAGATPRIDFVDMPPDIRDCYQYFTQASMERLSAAGYDHPFTRLEDGVAEYVRGYLAKAPSGP